MQPTTRALAVTMAALPSGLAKASSLQAGNPLKASKETEMRISRKAAALILPICLLVSTPANAKGCLRGALVGGVAGHYAHHHAVAGAMAAWRATCITSTKRAKSLAAELKQSVGVRSL